VSPLSSDARLLELDFLSRLSRYESIQVLNDRNVPRRDMIVHLLLEEMVNGVAGIKNIAGTTDFKAKLIVQQAEYERLCTLVEFLAGKQVIIRISHKGRVRLAELEQAIKIGREREPFGILFAARYWERDLRIALLSASKESPVTLCFLDMNGLKAINDVHGHEAGNEAIRAFLRVVATNVEELGEAYRYGGDEVVVILQGTDADAAGRLMTALLRQLGEEKIKGCEKLSASCGIGVTTEPDMDPKIFSQAVDATQYKAKAESKAGSIRRSALAVEGCEVQLL